MPPLQKCVQYAQDRKQLGIYMIQSICQWLDVYKQNYTITYLSSFFSASNKPYFSYVIWNNPI